MTVWCAGWGVYCSAKFAVEGLSESHPGDIDIPVASTGEAT
jgi:hypothetical protein